MLDIDKLVYLYQKYSLNSLPKYLLKNKDFVLKIKKTIDKFSNNNI